VNRRQASGHSINTQILRGIKIMRVFLISMVLLAMTGCGDEFWCGENGCGADKGSNINRTT